jgi:hypothetical protein
VAEMVKCAVVEKVLNLLREKLIIDRSRKVHKRRIGIPRPGGD